MAAMLRSPTAPTLGAPRATMRPRLSSVSAISGMRRVGIPPKGVPALRPSAARRRCVTVRAEVRPPQEAAERNVFPSLSNIDVDREEARRFRRSVFTPADWVKHRRSSRWIRNITTMNSSRIVRAIIGPMALTCGLAVIAAVMDQLIIRSILPAIFSKAFALSPTPHALTGASIGLLLVFRTNTSYDRWWEARKLWGALLNRSRDVTRQIYSYVREPADREQRDQMVRYVMCLTKSLMVHLRTGHDVTVECSHILRPDEMRRLEASTHRPNHVLTMLSKGLSRVEVDSMSRANIDANLSHFADVVGACERILRTPVPLAYTRHTARCMMLWLMFLPFALVSSCHLATIPITALTTFLLLGIEELGVQIEEPFSILPLETISGTAESNIKEMRNEWAVEDHADVDPAVESEHVPATATVTAA